MGVKTDVFRLFDYNFRSKLAHAMRKGLVGHKGKIEEFAHLVQKNFGDPGDAQAEFDKLADKVREALINGIGREDAPGYDAVASRKVVDSYRSGEGRFPGALLKALRDPSQVVATPNGIEYLNTQLLDQEARHWRRLNFGAAGTAVSSTVNYYKPVKFDQRVLFYSGSRAGLRPAFFLPPGRWFDASGNRVPYSTRGPGEPTTDRFYPGGRATVRPTRGIEGRHFIDAGFAVISAQYGATLSTLFRKWGGDASARSAGSSTETVLVE